MKSILDFKQYKTDGKKISMTTCYNYWSAKIIGESPVDAVLVGDSVAMVEYGHPDTLMATTTMIAQHTQAVSRGINGKFIVADMPFLSFRKGTVTALENAQELMTHGAQAVKVEGVWGHEETVYHLVQSGIPVMGHIGLTPQSVHQLGGYKVQGKSNDKAKDLMAQALKLEELGCFSLVLECVPEKLAKAITQSLEIPTIGIGAGAHTDGQILVLNDLLGLTQSDFKPKFVREVLRGKTLFAEALKEYCQVVSSKEFPSAQESYL